MLEITQANHQDVDNLFNEKVEIANLDLAKPSEKAVYDHLAEVSVCFLPEVSSPDALVDLAERESQGKLTLQMHFQAWVRKVGVTRSTMRASAKIAEITLSEDEICNPSSHKHRELYKAYSVFLEGAVGEIKEFLSFLNAKLKDKMLLECFALKEKQVITRRLLEHYADV